MSVVFKPRLQQANTAQQPPSTDNAKQQGAGHLPDGDASWGGHPLTEMVRRGHGRFDVRQLGRTADGDARRPRALHAGWGHLLTEMVKVRPWALWMRNRLGAPADGEMVRRLRALACAAGALPTEMARRAMGTDVQQAEWRGTCRRRWLVAHLLTEMLRRPRALVMCSRLGAGHLLTEMAGGAPAGEDGEAATGTHDVQQAGGAPADGDGETAMGAFDVTGRSWGRTCRRKMVRRPRALVMYGPGEGALLLTEMVEAATGAFDVGLGAGGRTCRLEMVRRPWALRCAAGAGAHLAAEMAGGAPADGDDEAAMGACDVQQAKGAPADGDGEAAMGACDVQQAVGRHLLTEMQAGGAPADGDGEAATGTRDVQQAKGALADGDGEAAICL
ncbi:hypothetical protein CYMTET_21692 [Cymbomonas tetramitiformis]|uniref:Uncharacterized protein n=1 Tax=Cymbomonas tetramitiformis TaxID=36881 RepID=A0AAE0G1D5_9CHLO|nr:hypothetical protein CYMTET_21692 [Cymbomonas tetramitiformis]